MTRKIDQFEAPSHHDILEGLYELWLASLSIDELRWFIREAGARLRELEEDATTDPPTPR